MSVFAIADLHLGLGVSKPMDIFGQQWAGHDLRLRDGWIARVGTADTVLIAGDISWAMNLDEALPDLRFLDRLPGRKVLLRGNHDYWWTSIAKMEQFCRSQALDSLTFLRNNSLAIEDWRICGTRGWILPDDPEFRTQDEKIHLREIGRLRLSLEDACRQDDQRPLLVCLHYPPFGRTMQPTGYTELMAAFGVGRCLFGHIHGQSPDRIPAQPAGPIRYDLIAADYLGFTPLVIDRLSGADTSTHAVAKPPDGAAARLPDPPA
jgi:hypothetical protein